MAVARRADPDKIFLAIVGGLLLGLGICFGSYLLGVTLYVLLAIVLMILVTLVGSIFWLGMISRESWRNRRKV